MYKEIRTVHTRRGACNMVIQRKVTVLAFHNIDFLLLFNLPRYLKVGGLHFLNVSTTEKVWDGLPVFRK